MACPFLSEGRARYCHAAPVRKLILDGPGVTGGLCASPEYWQCELVAKTAPREQRCPHLEDIQVQYCGASPVTKLVPFTESDLSSCSGGNHRYCDLFLERARPHPSIPPPELLYSPNHIGIDVFLADVVGNIQGIVFATSQGTRCPALTLTVQGVEWPMFFPNPMTIQKVNNRARRDPARLTSDPYGSGWLFEGREVPGSTRSGLVSGAKAAAWQEQERERLARRIHNIHAAGCDGGACAPGVARFLSRPDLVCLFQQFFSDSARWEE
jgi:hypothetical protein